MQSSFRLTIRNLKILAFATKPRSETLGGLVKAILFYGIMEVLEKEFWVPIKGYENEYHISSHGRVMSLERKVKSGKRTIRIKRKILKLHTNDDGYFVLTLNKNGIQNGFRVGRLVAIHFVDNPENKKEVNHIDEIKSNDYYKNLEWTTPKQNVNHGTCIQRRSEKLSKKVLQYDLNGNFIREWNSTMECERNGFHSGCISDCCNNKRKKHQNFIWKYKQTKQKKRWQKSKNKKKL